MLRNGRKKRRLVEKKGGVFQVGRTVFLIWTQLYTEAAETPR